MGDNGVMGGNRVMVMGEMGGNKVMGGNGVAMG